MRAISFPMSAALLAPLLAVPLYPAAAAEIQVQATNPVVELNIKETVRSDPDAAQVGAGVTVRAPSASEAMRQNAARMENVIARLRQLGIAREDIQTANFNLNAQYRYDNGGSDPAFLGYDASNQVRVTLRDLDRIGATLDALVEAGANNVHGPNFILEDDEAVRAQGRKSAFARARQQAEEYARMAGFSGVRLLEVSESYDAAGPIMVTAARESAAAKAPTPIEPGQVGTAVTVTAKYEMTR